MRSRQNPLLWLLDKDYYENFDAYMPRKGDFYEEVFSKLPPNWQMWRKEIWFYCISPRNHTPRQGWKIHVSATPGNAREVLSRVVAVLFDSGDTDFKFALDAAVLILLNSKNWPRGSSSKFITIYPHENQHFLDLIKKIHQATEGLRGPYILSDYRYDDSGVVFYRYGGMRSYPAVDIKGEHPSLLICPDGKEIRDERRAYPLTPPWAAAVLPQDTQPMSRDTTQTLRGGRYKIEASIGFSNSGGVYRGEDSQSGRKVVIKEARPLVNSTPDGYDAVELLKKEYRLLTCIADTGIAAAPIEFFQEWEHSFLVEEYIDGIPLSVHSSEHNILLRTRPTPADFKKWLNNFYSACEQLIRLVRVLHSRKIVFADLSPSNLLVESRTGKLKLIDFEGAYQIGADPKSSIYTPGFVSQERLAGADAAIEDDCYAVGAVLMAYLFPVNSFFHLKPTAKLEIMGNIQRDINLPGPVAQMVLTLMDPNPARRQLPDGMETVLEAGNSIENDARPKASQPDYQAVVDDIVVHLNDVASYSRQDKLFPADPKLFATNPISLAYGAAGIGYALQKITRRFQPDIADWILRHNVTPATYAPGLYLGMAGAAWGLLEMGIREEAEDMFKSTFHHRLREESADMFYGLAGWGTASLRFFQETQNEIYLEQAEHAGHKLLASSQNCERGCYWDTSRETALGFAHGSSGIAAFLLYLYLATGDEHFLATGQRALEFDLSFAVRTKDGGLSWGQSVNEERTVYPYWQYGSAGIGTVVMRYFRLLGNARYRSILEDIFVDTDRKYAVRIGRFMGLAGLGSFLLDLYEMTAESRFFNAAEKVAKGILQFRVARRGSAFPGDSLSRFSCDYGTGSAGIALFLNRLSGRQESDFMLDSLFEKHSSSQHWSKRQRHSLACT